MVIVNSYKVAGMSVTFPITVGLALVIGVILNYIAEAKGDPIIHFAGVGLVVIAIVVNALAYRTVPLDSIRLSDPCILADHNSKTYYMTGSGGFIMLLEVDDSGDKIKILGRYHP